MLALQSTEKKGVMEYQYWIPGYRVQVSVKTGDQMWMLPNNN